MDRQDFMFLREFAEQKTDFDEVIDVLLQDSAMSDPEQYESARAAINVYMMQAWEKEVLNRLSLCILNDEREKHRGSRRQGFPHNTISAFPAIDSNIEAMNAGLELMCQFRRMISPISNYLLKKDIAKVIIEDKERHFRDNMRITAKTVQ